MRRDYKTNPGETKANARKKYAERQIHKWVDWSWKMRGRVIYKELMEQIKKMNEEKEWTISIGFYPGILFGFRSYESDDMTTHVLYVPFFDIALQLIH